MNELRMSIFLLSVFVLVSATRASEAEAGFSYDDYASVLRAHVNEEGYVNYETLNESPETLEAFLQQIASLEYSAFETWPEPDQIAFWINAYNAYTLKAIIDHYPIEPSFFGQFRFPANSIRQISGVWDTLTWSVMGREMTLDQMEHGTLRRQHNEPRIHFAVNCASIGCPVLRNTPYTGDGLDEQLDEQVHAYLNRYIDFRLDRENKTVYLSKILDWYGEDFEQFASQNDDFAYLGEANRGTMNFLMPYLGESDQDWLRENRIRVRFIDYNWSLNTQ